MTLTIFPLSVVSSLMPFGKWVLSRFVFAGTLAFPQRGKALSVRLPRSSSHFVLGHRARSSPLRPAHIKPCHPFWSSKGQVLSKPEGRVEVLKSTYRSKITRFIMLRGT
jgi:hypothetical protein